MKKHKLLISLLLLAIIGGTVQFSTRKGLVKEFEKEFEAENEERPDNLISAEEEAMFLAYLESRQNPYRLKSAGGGTEMSYANGELTGTWNSKLSQSGWYGYRVDNSAYDSLRDVFYVVSFAGHLYKLEYQNEVKWTLLNHKIQLNPPNNNSANPIFIGTLLPDSTFRLIRSNDAQYRMEYSDDEGISWNISSGAHVTQSWSNQAFEITNNGQKKIVLHTYDAGYHHLYFSSDNGESYTESALSFSIEDLDARITKPFFTNDAYLWVWNKESNEISTYQYSPASNDFELLLNSSSTLAGTNLSSAAATYYDGTMHFYLSTINSTYTIYYSSDSGATWTQKNAGRDKPFETIVPQQPNILLSGFEDIKVSADYGTNFTGMDHKLGWDLQHMRTYEKSGNKTVTLAGLDFGCYISETPEDKNSYKWCNNGAWYAMHYDAASSENFNSIYMANQDRGATAYNDSGIEVGTIDVDGTDVLRVSYANHETSVWTWFYYGRIKHRFNFATGKSGSAVYDGLGMWWAAPIIASPNPSEDAIYLADGSNLQIFKYDESTNGITKSAHPFNFKTNFGDNLGGFGYSEIDRNLWYAALNNGTFLYSHNAGETWTKSEHTGSKPTANKDHVYNKEQIVIKASQIDANTVYYAGVSNRFLISNDNGKTFSLKINGLSVLRIRDFALSPDEKFIFAACGLGGAWVYSVDNNYWYQMSDDPVPSVDFTDVEFIHRKNCVRFGTYGSGIIELTLDKQFYSITAPDNLKATLNSSNQVELSWADKSNNENGFYIEKATDGDFVRIATVEANVTTYIETNIDFDQTCYYRVKAFNNESSSFKSNLAFLKIPLKGYIYQANWKIVSVSSEELVGGDSPAKYAIDNNTATVWHTEWKNTKPPHPHYIVIDLGVESTVAGFRYLPRQDGNENGSIADYEFYVSNNLSDWGSPEVSGTFGSGADLKESMFDAPTTGRYVKLVALSEINGKDYTSAAEIFVLYQQVPPDGPANFTAETQNDTSVLLKWEDNSMNASGFIIEQLIDGSFVAIDSVDINQISFTVGNLLPGTLYTFRVKAYNKGGYSEPTESVEAKTTGTKIEETLKVNWQVFPNPCQSFITIKVSALKKAALVKVLNLEGKTCITEQIKQGSTQIDLSLSDLPSGNYIIELSSNGKRTNKIISKR